MDEKTKVSEVKYPYLDGGKPLEEREAENMGLLLDVTMPITVELGRTKMLIKDVLQLGEGSIVELDKNAGEPADVYVGDKLVAKGEVVVIDDDFAIRITEIVGKPE